MDCIVPPVIVPAFVIVPDANAFAVIVPLIVTAPVEVFIVTGFPEEPIVIFPEPEYLIPEAPPN